MARDPKHDVLFSDQDRTEDSAQPFLPGAALHRRRLRPARFPGGEIVRSRPRAVWAGINTEYCSIHPESDDRTACRRDLGRGRCAQSARDDRPHSQVRRLGRC